MAPNWWFFFPTLALFIPTGLLLITIGAVTAIFVTWEIVRFTSPSVNQWILSHLRLILKREERLQLTGATYLLLSSLAVFLLFEKYVAITSLLFLSVGDLMATVIGEKFGKRKISSKSLEGSLACLVSCFLIGMVMTKVGAEMAFCLAGFCIDLPGVAPIMCASTWQDFISKCKFLVLPLVSH
ncbi:MAG: hypothetical protein KAW00_01730 [Dehalococcoidia bacterium]|nr:hypothetical protein [Dehalococcoidia bacterium]